MLQAIGCFVQNSAQKNLTRCESVCPLRVLDNEPFLTKNSLRSLQRRWNCGNNVLWQRLLVCSSCCCCVHNLPCWYRRHTADLPFDGVKLTLSLSVHNLCTCQAHRPKQIHKKDWTKRRSLMPAANPPGQSLPISFGSLGRLAGH